MEINGSVALITGSTRGIGRGIAIKLAEHGAKLVVNYRSNVEAAKRFEKELMDLGVDFIVVRADVSNYNSASYLVDSALETYGNIDILVNNAGVFKAISFHELSWQEWDYIIKNNLYSVFNVTRLVVPHMIKRRRGVVINISSITSSIRSSKCLPYPGRVAYATSKSGINGFTLALARELAPYGIRVNAIAPGLIETELIRGVPNLDDRVREVPLGRIGKPSEIGDTVVFLVRNEYINGEIIVVSGGE